MTMIDALVPRMTEICGPAEWFTTRWSCAPTSATG